MSILIEKVIDDFNIVSLAQTRVTKRKNTTQTGQKLSPYHNK